MSEVSKRKHFSHILAVTASSVKEVSSVKPGVVKFSQASKSLPFEVDDIIVGSRHLLETNPAYKQIIPYVVVVRGSKILVYKRTTAGGESRLHEKASIGFGGHVDVGDIVATEKQDAISLENTVMNASIREVVEELHILTEPKFKAYGLLNDDSDEVGQVHVGVVMICHVNDSDIITSAEDQVDLVGFKTIEEIMADETIELENWSKLVLEAFSSEEG